jgi:uncharacterized protein (DUF1501 family)
MNPHSFLSRRSFLGRSFKASLAVGLSTLLDIPLVIKRALAEGTIGLEGKKLLFLWLRGANDGLNSVIPVEDPAYYTARPTGGSNIGIPMDSGTDYTAVGRADFPANEHSGDATYSYANAIRLGNGFAALHPSLKFLAPVYNAGDLALVHRVGYPRQSRSHFDSQNYWENGVPRSNVVKDGIFYRAMLESGLASTAPLTGISIQSSLPLILRGSQAAMTNLSDPLRYNLLGVPDTDPGNAKADAAILRAIGYPFAAKKNRDLLELQYQNMANTLEIFAGIDFTEDGNTFRDDEITDNDTDWAQGNQGEGYYLFPTKSEKNGGWLRPDGSNQPDKYLVPTSGHSLFQKLKAAALILNKTDAIVAGTELTGFDTHSNQGGATGRHSDLNRQVGWAVYALRKYFTRYADKVSWNDVVVVTLTEFGRTTVQNSGQGTDHAEAGVMFVAGGPVQGFNKGHSSGVFLCHPDDSIPWVVGPADQADGKDGSMFAVNGRYLRRAADYRSVLGELIRNHLGATQAQLDRIIPGYADAGENLKTGGSSAYDGTPIVGELGLV